MPIEDKKLQKVSKIKHIPTKYETHISLLNTTTYKKFLISSISKANAVFNSYMSSVFEKTPVKDIFKMVTNAYTICMLVL